MDEDPNLHHIRSELLSAKYNAQELSSALQHLGEGPAYRLIGKILVKKDVNKLKLELEKELELITVKISILEKQCSEFETVIKEGIDG
jgi:chaperonin cofactor prefoldin